MEHGGKNITEVKLYNCGYCKNNMRHVFRKNKKEIREFPALAVRLEHKTLGTVLYDTGYSDLIYKNHVISFLYNALNRSFVRTEDTIPEKLVADGIAPECVKRVILSHAHPDHMGGLRLLRGYELISTERVLATMWGGSPFHLVFRNMIPEKEIACRAVKPFAGTSVLDGYFERIYDVFEDGSVLGVELNGHAKGQLGIFLPEYNLFFVADACWGADLLCKVRHMRLAPRCIQNDYKAYVETVERLVQFTADHPEIHVVYSHDRREEIRYE